MKTSYIKALAGLLLAGSLASCGDKFLETDMFGNIDSTIALNSVSTVGYALNGAYYNLGYYYFAGTEATAFGDLASDLIYWNQKSNHFGDIYQFTPSASSVILRDVWAYGYKVVDSSTRVIKGAEKLLAEGSDEEDLLNRYIAEAYALRAYAQLVLVNNFAHQVKVDGQDFSAEPGIVIVTTPVGESEKVSRSTIGESYAAIESDLENSLKYFDLAGKASETDVYFTPKAVKGLQARVYLYEEKWQDAADAAEKALELGNIAGLVDTNSAYKALYNVTGSNTESFFYLAINSLDNWSANSMGTLWSTYSYSPSPWLQSVMAEDDCRRAVWGWGEKSTPSVPIFNGGKFTGLSGNPAYGTCYLINAPEMYLIQAEAKAHLSDASGAAEALLEVAKRNPAIESVSDLPADADGILAFIKDERARELFQEGHRLWDLRRWGQKVNVYAQNAPSISWLVTDYDISGAVYPIPDNEINTGMGVSQNANWISTFPN